MVTKLYQREEQQKEKVTWSVSQKFTNSKNCEASLSAGYQFTHSMYEKNDIVYIFILEK
jgi:hypothetical protein